MDRDASQLRLDIESLFPYQGSFDWMYIEPLWCKGRIIAETFAFRTPKTPGCEQRLISAMLGAFENAKRTLGGRSDVGIMWRRTPYFVTEDNGDVVLRMRAAIVDSDGQITVSGLPLKLEGELSKAI